MGKKEAPPCVFMKAKSDAIFFLADRMDENGGKKVMVYLVVYILWLLNLQLLAQKYFYCCAGGFLGIQYYKESERRGERGGNLEKQLYYPIAPVTLHNILQLMSAHRWDIHQLKIQNPSCESQ